MWKIGDNKVFCRRFSFMNTKKENMEIPKIKEGESLAMWRRRLTDTLKLDYLTQEIMRVVSITSYVKGNDDMLEALKTTNESNNTNKTN
jgi:hypothetical protein